MVEKPSSVADHDDVPVTRVVGPVADLRHDAAESCVNAVGAEHGDVETW